MIKTAWKSSKQLILLAVLFLFTAKLYAGTLAVIPEPVEITETEGYFQITPTTFIYCNDIPAFFDAVAFRDYTIAYYDLALKAGHDLYYNTNYIRVRYDSTLQVPDEGYTLIVGSDSIVLTGKNKGGVFYGLMTLIQLIDNYRSDQFRIPCCKITDYPRFSYRGMHLDCARHFFPVDFIKKYIDYLALYKYNTFHWHLTDDQGWRIEIKQYPKLTEIGAWRDGTMVGHYRDQQYDTIRYGGYYTQKEIKDIVKYAEKRHVTIIPEIEMPGHSLAALASYPEFSCNPAHASAVGKAWGEYSDVFCPTEETFTFLQNILSEVMQLFPSEYIHIGGDEVDKTDWKQNPFCQQLIKEKQLKDENGLQSYFTRRIEEFVNSRGKKIIGWDEILEGGVAPNAVVMSWRGEDGGVAAATQHHYAIMTPGAFCYFDHYQGAAKYEPLAIGGYTTLEKVYNYEPISIALSAEAASFILGAQGNVWTEYINNPQAVEYMAIPRMLALSEVLWSPKSVRNYNEFVSRLLVHFTLLDRVNCNYSKSIFQVECQVISGNENGIRVQLKSIPIQGSRLQYNIESDGPGYYDYEQSIQISTSTRLNYSFTVPGHGEFFGEQQFEFNRATGKQITLTYDPSPKYPGDGPITLVNGIMANPGPTWSGNEWLGFYGTDCIATIDLGTLQEIHKVTVGILADRGSWIWPSDSMQVSVSEDGVHYHEIAGGDKTCTERILRIAGFTGTAKFIRIHVYNAGIIPTGYAGSGKKSWLFVDEISVE